MQQKNSYGTGNSSATDRFWIDGETPNICITTWPLAFEEKNVYLQNSMNS